MARKSKYSTAPEVKQNGNRIYHAGIYLRRSYTENEEKDKCSLRSQRMICLNYLKDKPEIMPCSTYVDDGYSGGSFQRPEFQRLLSDVKAGHIDRVVVKDLSRFGRNYLDVEDFMTVQFPSMGVRFISVSEQYDSMYSENADEQKSLMIPFYNILNEQYLLDISKKTRSSIYSKMDEGTYLPSASVIPYGYLRDAKNHTYQIDEEIAPVIRRIFTLRSEGMSYFSIAKCLMQDGALTPGQRRHQLYGGVNGAKKWTSGMVFNIVVNPVYIGHRTHRKNHSDPLKPDDTTSVTVIKNAHEAIVSQELFDSAQWNEDTPKRTSHIPDENMEYEFDCRAFLEGKVICGDCGATMKTVTTVVRQRKTEKTGLLFRSSCCHQRTVLHKWVYHAVNAIVEQQSDCADDLTLMKKTLRASQNSGSYKLLMRKKRSIQVKLKNAGGWLERLFEDYLAGLLDRDEYLFAKEKYRKDYEALLEEEAAVLKEIEAYKAAIEAAQNWILHRERYTETEKLTDELLSELIQTVKVFHKRQLEITLTYQDVFQRLLPYAEEETNV